MSGDVHTPTNAGPEPSADFGTTAGASGIDAAPNDKPEIQVGAAFAGGLVVAMILKRLRGRD
ncbi:MAG: hypothetical protein ACJ762_03830 [Solirubrobacteraceae bacterium]